MLVATVKSNQLAGRETAFRFENRCNAPRISLALFVAMLLGWVMLPGCNRNPNFIPAPASATNRAFEVVEVAGLAGNDQATGKKPEKGIAVSYTHLTLPTKRIV